MADCIFCRIASGEIPSKVVAGTDNAMAFRDLNPQAPTHILVIPKRHLAGATDANGDPSVWSQVMSLATRVAQEEGIAESGFRLVVNQGHNAGQSVDHLHVHLLGGRRMSWPPG